MWIKIKIYDASLYFREVFSLSARFLYVRVTFFLKFLIQFIQLKFLKISFSLSSLSSPFLLLPHFLLFPLFCLPSPSSPPHPPSPPYPSSALFHSVTTGEVPLVSNESYNILTVCALSPQYSNGDVEMPKVTRHLIRNDNGTYSVQLKRKR